MNIADIRQKFPQYDDLDDIQLARALHDRFYADLPFEDFAAKVGLVQQNTSNLGDIGTAAKQGALGSVKAITDVFGAENAASKYLEDKLQKAQLEYSPSRQAELKQQAERMKKAEKEGLLSEILAGAQNVAEAPLQSIAQGVGSFAPYALIPALRPLTTALKLAPAAAAAVESIALTSMGAAQGAGAVKGAIYDAVYEKEVEAGVDPAVAKNKAEAAQNYFGKNWEQIVAGGALGAFAARSGVEPLLTKQGAEKASAKLLPRVGKAVAEESLTEAPQGGQERLAQNLAQQREGYDTPTWQGVAGQATQEGLTAAFSAAPIAGLRKPPAPNPLEQRQREQAAAEAAKNSPEALAALEAQYRDVESRRYEFEQALAEKPAKGDKDAAQAYAETARAYAAFKKQEYQPVVAEYNQRRDLIAAPYEAQMASMEQAAAAEQPSAAAPIFNSNVPVPTVKLMEQYDGMRQQLFALQEQLSTAPDVDTQRQLQEQRSVLMAQMGGLGSMLEERGAPTMAQGELQAELAKEEKKRQDLLAKGDFDAAAPQADKVEALQKQLAHYTELADYRQNFGQTRELGLDTPPQPAPAKQGLFFGMGDENAVNKFVALPDQTVGPADVAAPGADAAPAENTVKQPDFPSREGLTFETGEGDKKTEFTAIDRPASELDALDTRIKELRTELSGFRDNDIQARGQAAAELKDLNERRTEVLRQANNGLDLGTLDLFSDFNLLQTGVRNNDADAIRRMTQEAELRRQFEALLDRRQQRLLKVGKHPDTALQKAYNTYGLEKLVEEAQRYKDKQKRQLTQRLDERLGLTGTGRERVNMFDDYYDAPSKARFKNGTYPDPELQAVYDKGGPALVEEALLEREIAPLRAKVEGIQGNAKQSVYDQLVQIAAEHAELQAKLERGVADPTTGEKIAGLGAKFGKGEAPAPRAFDASERYQLQRKITSLQNKFNKLVETKVAPVRAQIEQKLEQLYRSKPLASVTTLKAEQKAASNAEARKPKTMSRAAKTQKRIESGDVRREALKSEELVKLSRTLGEATPEYEKFNNALMERLDRLKQKYGANDPKVNEFRITMGAERLQKAEELGRATPEYKATVKEQVAVVREALSQSKQEPKSKRDKTPVTRKSSGAPTRLVTSSPESRAASEKASLSSLRKTLQDYKDAVDSENVGTAYRFKEGEADTVVNAAEAQKVIDGLKLPDNVKLVYAPTAGKIPVRLLKQMAKDGVEVADGVVKGAVFPDGTVLVVGDQHADVKDLEETIAHELIGHYGVDTVIGIDRVAKYAKDTDLEKLATTLGGDKLAQEVRQTMKDAELAGLSPEIQRLQAMREIIAHTEEARVDEAFRDRAKRFIKELVGMVREALRSMGLVNLAEASTSDVFYMLRRSRKAFKDKTVGPYRAADGQVAFRRAREPSKYSSVGTTPGIMDTLLGNFMGLAGRVQLVDQYAATSAALKRGVDAGVLSSVEATNAEFLLRFGQQRSMYAGQFLTNGPVQMRTEKRDGATVSTYKSSKGTSMVDVAKALSKANLGSDAEQETMFTIYLAGERARQVGWEKLNVKNPDKARAEYADVMAQLAGDAAAKDAFKEAAKLYQQYNNGLVDFLVQTGAITPKRGDELKSVTYVPYYRIKDGEVQLMIDREHPVRIGNIKDEPQLQQLVGGNDAIMSVFTSAVQNTFMLTGMGLRNQAVKETAFALQKLGIASRVAPGKGPSGDRTDVVRFKRRGEDYYAIIDTDAYGVPADLIVKGMEGIKTTLPAVIKLLGVPADILRSFVVRNPAYAIRQVIRDPLNAWMTNGTSATPILSSMKELAHMVAGRSETERTLMEAGAISSNVFSGDERDMSKFLKNLSEGRGGWQKLLARADAFALQGDAATRAVIYKDSLAKGMTEQEALLRTLESMNFSRKGVSPSMQALSVMIPFFNAQIQGLDVLWRAFNNQMPFSEQLEVRKKLLQRGLLLAAGTMAYATMMRDDEAYKRAKPEERYANWFVRIPGVSEPVKVPIPFELGYLFKALPEAVMNIMADDSKADKALGGMWKLLEQSNPFSLPQAVKPLTEAVLGKSFYGGDIESPREKNELATDRYRANSTEVAKLLGSVTGNVGISPITIDYLIRGYTGGLGVALVQLANPLLAPLATKETGPKPSMKPSQMPFVGGLFQTNEGRGTLDEAYDRMLHIQQTKNTYTKMVEEGRRAEAHAFMQRNLGELVMGSTSGAVQKELGEFAKQERYIRSHPKMTQAQKDAALAALDKAKIDRARAFLAMADKTTRQAAR